jgi:iron-sulfur cluster repair protein YtfE (RIC family)
MTVSERDKIDFTMMYATHRAFGRDVDRLIAAGAAGKTGTREVRDGWANFMAQLHLHHSVEDTHLWPPLRRLVAGRSGDLALLDEMEAEHARLGPLLASVDAALAGPPAAVVGPAQELKASLDHHLRHEEDDALPLVQSVLSRAAWRKFTAQMRRRQGVKGAAIYIPWVLDGAAPAERRQFLGQLPVPGRVVNGLLWQTRYEKRDWWKF